MIFVIANNALVGLDRDLLIKRVGETAIGIFYEFQIDGDRPAHFLTFPDEDARERAYNELILYLSVNRQAYDLRAFGAMENTP